MKIKIEKLCNSSNLWDVISHLDYADIHDNYDGTSNISIDTEKEPVHLLTQLHNVTLTSEEYSATTHRNNFDTIKII